MNCPSCGAPLRLEEDADRLECAYCGNIYLPEKNADGVRVLGEPADLGCPVCSTPLVHAALSGFRLLYCERCRGMLVKMPVFAELIQDLRAHREGPASVQHAADPRELQRRLECPGCHHQMETHFYAGPGNIVIDDCERCGLNWLDAGELTRIVHAPDGPHFTD